MLQALLKVKGGKQDGKLIPLDTKKFLIGREQDCHLRPGSESVSRHHCAISIDDYSVRIRDLGSSNGTWLNNSRVIGVQEAQPGDVLKVGTLEFELVFSKTGAPVSVGSGSVGSGAGSADPGSEKGGTTFDITELPLDEAADLASTTVMSGDTAVIRKSDLQGDSGDGQQAEEAATESAENAVSEEQPAETTPVADAPAAEAGMPADENPVTAAPVDAGQQPPGYPPQQQMPPYGAFPQQPQMPGFPPQMPGYPGYAPQYPYGMPQPGYGMPQPGYGMPYGAYPQQPVAGYPGMVPQQPPVDSTGQPPEETEADHATDEPAVKLPDPSETGIKEPVQQDGDGDAPKPAAPPNPAEEILKKYKTRR